MRNLTTVGKIESKKIEVNGVIYDSISESARKIGWSYTILASRFKDLKKSSFSELETRIQITQILKLGR